MKFFLKTENLEINLFHFGYLKKTQCWGYLRNTLCWLYVEYSENRDVSKEAWKHDLVQDIA